MYWTVLADATLSENRYAVIIVTLVLIIDAFRTQVLFYLHAITHSGRLIAPLVGAALLEKRLWAPFAFAMAIFYVKYALIRCMPETSPYLSSSSFNRSSEPVQRRDPSGEDNREPARSAYPSTETDPLHQPQHQDQSALTPTRYDVLRGFFHHRGLIIIFVCFFFKRIGFTSELLTFQYALEKYNKKLSETVWLRTFNAIGATLILGVLLPLATKAFSLRSPRKDRWVILLSLVDLMSSALILWQNQDFAMLCIGIFRQRCSVIVSPDQLSRHVLRRLRRGPGTGTPVSRLLHSGRATFCGLLLVREYP